MFDAIKIPINYQFGGSTNTSNYQKITIIVIVLLFVITSFYLYNHFYNSKSFNANYEHGNSYTDTDDSSSSSSSSSTAEVMFFYVDWCPHCKTAKPVWDSFSKDNQGIKTKNYNVIFTEINCTKETEQSNKLMNKYNIEGFPTIIMLKDDEVIQFDAKPTPETLNQFLNNTLN